MEKVEREVAKARSLIVDREFRNGNASRKEKEARVLSRAAEKMERELIDNLETDLTLKGWSISTLIHDEIIIQRPVDEKIHHDLVNALSRDAKLALRNFENTKGWAPGTLDVNVVPIENAFSKTLCYGPALFSCFAPLMFIFSYFLAFAF